MEGSGQQNTQEYARQLDTLKRDLNPHRAVMLFLNKVLEWEPVHIPAIVVGAVTFLFALIWYLEPSMLTLFSLLGLVITLVDFASPTLSHHFYRQEPGSKTQWTELDEIHFERTCTRLLNAKNHATDGLKFLVSLKRDKPQLYLVTVLGVLILLAWVGSLMDNLLLLYLIVIFIMLIPGLRKHGILQKFTSKISGLVKSKFPKSKTN